MGKLHLYWDPEIEGAFRRRLERALGELRVNSDDAAYVDVDPDAPRPVKMAVVSARGGFTPPQDADLVLLGGPGDFADTSRAMRLETADIETHSKRWAALCDQLAKKLGRGSLVVPPEDLAVMLDEATRRADDAESARAEFELQRNNALRSTKHAEAELASSHARIAKLEQTIERLTALAESSAFVLSDVKDDLKSVVNGARDHAWRARLAAARAEEAAETHPDALAWPKAHATYSGETRNRLPHGHGVIIFRSGGEEIARYAGQFEDGRREGHGVATSDGMTWFGAMKDGEACGLGVLDAPGGARFEGEVAPGEDGAPRQVRGHAWDTKTAAGRRQEPHRPAAPALASPHAPTRAAGG